MRQRSGGPAVQYVCRIDIWDSDNDDQGVVVICPAIAALHLAGHEILFAIVLVYGPELGDWEDA